MGNFYNDLTNCFNSDGKMIYSYTNAAVTICDDINFSKGTGTIMDIDENTVQILYDEKDIVISIDKLQYDDEDEMYIYHDSGTDISISFVYPW